MVSATIWIMTLSSERALNPVYFVVFADRTCSVKHQRPSLLQNTVLDLYTLRPSDENLRLYMRFQHQPFITLCNMTSNINAVRSSSINKLRQAVTVYLMLSVSVCNPAHALTLDGRLDEQEWKDARVINDFIKVAPYSLSKPEYNTEARVISNQDGIYIGIKNTQPLPTQSTELTARDSDMSADTNQIIIDFDASNISAYSFEVGNGGSIKDGIWRNENQYSNDWDGSWQAQTSQDDTHWYAEVLLPWNIVPMAGVDGDDPSQRPIKIYLSRRVKELGVSYANVAASSNRQRFMSDFAGLGIGNFAQSSFQTFAYASGRQNTIGNDKEFDVGADLFWKSSDGKQLSVAINPDFGQVESDNLVVNFSPNETFFSERRPFFTQNQALFDVSGTQDLRVIHTRRIGGQPDNGPDFFSDILGAVKFTDSNQYLNYGVFFASEADSTDSLGRDYYVGRALRTTDNYDLGFTSTFTSRPEINREAMVNAVDYEYRWGKAITVKGQALHSSIESGADASQAKTGGSAWLTLEQQLSANKSQSLSLSHYAEGFEVNDLGFLPRANLDSLEYEYIYRKPSFADDSSIKNQEIAFSTEHQYSANGDHLISDLTLRGQWVYKNNSAFYWQANGYSDGRDDRITRGNNVLRTEDGYELRMTLFAKDTEKLKGHAHVILTDTFVGGKGFDLHLHPSYQFTDKYSASLGMFYIQTDDWLNWRGANQLGQYQRKQGIASLNFDAKLSEKQELRLKFQWVAVSADALNSLAVLANGDAIQDGEKVDDFSVSSTALQIRYRYELAPLSNLFIVYSRGGNIDLDETDSLGALFTQSWDNETSSNIFAKLRYQF
jgi:hypothetical protein